MNIKKLVSYIILLGVCAVANALDVEESGVRACVGLDSSELSGIDLNKYRSALVVNFDGEGVTTTSVKQGVYYDHDKNSFAEKSAWITSNNGFLIYQKDRLIAWSKDIETQTSLEYENKIINSFDVLRQYDSNQNGMIDENDLDFNELFIWVDYSKSGKIVYQELKSLSDLEIREISLNVGCEPFAMLDQHENIYKVKSNVRRTDGSILDIYELWLKADLVDTRDDSSQVTISDDIKKIPNVLGMGTLMSLHKALAVDQTGKMKILIESVIQRLKNGASFNSVSEDMHRLLVLWARAGDKNIDLQSENLMYQRRYVLEKSMGHSSIKFNDGTNIEPYEKVYLIMFDYVLDELIYNTRILGYLKSRDIKKNKHTGTYHFRTTKLTNALLQQFSHSSPEDFTRTLKIFKKVYGRKEVDRQIYGQVIRELVKADPMTKQLLDSHQIEIPTTPKKKIRGSEKHRKELGNGSYIEWSK